MQSIRENKIINRHTDDVEHDHHVRPEMHAAHNNDEGMVPVLTGEPDMIPSQDEIANMSSLFSPDQGGKFHGKQSDTKPYFPLISRTVFWVNTPGGRGNSILGVRKAGDFGDFIAELVKFLDKNPGYKLEVSISGRHDVDKNVFSKNSWLDKVPGSEVNYETVFNLEKTWILQAVKIMSKGKYDEKDLKITKQTIGLFTFIWQNVKVTER